MTNEEINTIKSMQNVPVYKPPAAITSEVEQNEAHKLLNKTFDDFQTIVGQRLDKLQKVIDELRLLTSDHTTKIKSQVGKHLNIAEMALKLSDDVGKELEMIKISLNGEK